MKYQRTHSILEPLCVLIVFTLATGCSVSESASELGEQDSIQKESPAEGLDRRLQKVGNVSVQRPDCALHFVNEQEGWVAEGKRLWRTGDGGRTWVLLFEGDPSWDRVARISSIQFLDSETGWMLVSPEGIYKTEDGGLNWKKMPDPIEDGVVYTLRFLPNGKEAWAGITVLRPPPKEYSDKVYNRGEQTP